MRTNTAAVRASAGTASRHPSSTPDSADTPGPSSSSSNHDAGSRSENTSSQGLGTPRSGSIFSFTGSSENQQPFAFGVDVPLPSIENLSPAIPGVSRPPFSARSSTPSISIFTPPPSSESSGPSDQHTGGPSRRRGHDGTGSMDGRLEAMRLSSSATPPSTMDMAELGAALDDITRTPGSQTSPPLLHPSSVARESASPEPSATRRRRSSSRPNQVPHDVRDEEPPQDQFHEPEFQQAFSEAKSLMANLAAVLESSTTTLHLEPDSVVRGLRQKADKLAKFKCPRTRTVGLVGDSGVGKSSLLNALLDFRGLARASDGGTACTSAVTEYTYHDRADFAVDVEVFTQDELKDQLAETVRAYRQYHLNSADVESVEDGEQATLAHDRLQAMFPGRFIPRLLGSGQSEDEILETLLGWARELGPANISRHEVRASLEDCSALLMRLTSGSSDHGPAVWPYVKRISVSLNAHILRNGLVLVDLPGLRDLNSARRNTTERYLLKCDEIFAVCQIGRAVSNEGVKCVFDLARQARLSNVGIICTKSDDIEPDEAQKDRPDSQAREIQNLMTLIKTAERELAEITERKEELKELGEDRLEEEEIELRELYMKIDKKEGVIENRKQELERYIMTTRIDDVIAQLTDKYQDDIPDGKLRVFCAGNRLYWKHRDVKPRDKALPFLQLSGIIAIRRHCMGLVSESQLRIATRYIQDDIPDLLSHVELWVQSGAGSASDEQKEIVRLTLDSLETRLRRELSGYTSPIKTLARGLADEFRVALYQRRRVRHWTQGAMHASSVWSRWSPASYIAFCRHYGTHTTSVGSHCWNKEAMKYMSRDIAEPWETFRSTVEGHLSDIVMFISETLDWASHHLNTALDGHSESLLPLRQALDSRQHLLAGAVEALCDEFGWELSTLRTDALSGLRTGFFGQSMEDCYNRCNDENGTGSWARKKAIMNGKLSDERLFEDLMTKFRNRFTDLAMTLQTDIEAVVEANLDVIRGTLDIIRKDNVALESERDPEFRRRVAGEIAVVKERLALVRKVIRDRPRSMERV